MTNVTEIKNNLLKLVPNVVYLHMCKIEVRKITLQMI